MHIRTIGELHDTINAQAKEIAQLKKDLINSKSLVSKFKTKYQAVKYPFNKRKNEKIRNIIIQWCEDSSKRTLKSISDEFHISYETAKNIAYKWRKENNIIKGIL